MILVLTTVGKKSNAAKIARSLVKKKLAACVNIIKIEKSVYRWKGKIVSEGEYLLLVKTTKMRYSRLETAIKVLHPYKLPEIIALPIKRGHDKYLDWVSDCV